MKKLLIPIAVFILLIVLMNVFYVVKEPEQVIITQFGKPVGDPIITPGLKLKKPFIQDVHRFEKRFLEWDGEANELPTRDKRFIYVNMYARWRITDPLLYFKRLRDERGAQTRLDDILDGETRNAIANYDLEEVVRNTNRTPVQTEGEPEDEKVLHDISKGRTQIRMEILAKSQERTSDLGIEILDVEFKRINYVQDVQQKVFERMISERQRIADRYRSEGQGEAFRIRGEKDRELLRIRSEAYRKSQKLKGVADAEAIKVYAEAYNTSAATRDFYTFLKTMEAYKITMDKETSLVLSTDADFYRFLKAGEDR